MKTILLTGSEGYIGKNFIHNYQDEFNFVNIDRKIGIDVLEYNDFQNIDYIVHLAAISGIANCEENKEQTIHDNITSTLYLIRKSKEYNIPIVFASSQGAKIPDNLYSITKRTCEIEAILYNNEYNTDIKVLRFANVYGGNYYLDTKTSVVSKFINAKLKNTPLIINGNGDQIRDFIYIDDITKAIYNSLNVKIPYPIDVGTGYGTSINLLADMIKHQNKIYNKQNNIGVESNIADTEDIKKYLGFKPKQSSLQKYIDRKLMRNL